MKTLLLALILLSAQISFADEITPETLVGKYLGLTEECDGLRVYIQISTDKSGNKHLNLNYYGDEAFLNSIRLGSGIKEGNSADPKKPISITWSSRTENDSFVAVEVAVSTRDGRASSQKWIFTELENGNISYVRTETSGTRNYETSCELQRQ